MRFIGEHAEHPHVKDWVRKGMVHFIEIHVKCFKNWKDVPVHFVGSIGHYFQDCLEAAAAETGIRLGQIIQKPIDGLIAYHKRFVLAEA
jgi:hypothetical protein